MKENIFTSMLTEGGKISHKRWISVSIGAVLAWAICYAAVKASNATERKAVIDATMLFILVMSGVATLPQLISLIRGNAAPKEGSTITKTEVSATVEETKITQP